MTNLAPSDVPDVVVEAAASAGVSTSGQRYITFTAAKASIAAALDAWPRGDLLKRVLTVECRECEAPGIVTSAGVVVQCPTCDGRGWLPDPKQVEVMASSHPTGFQGHACEYDRSRARATILALIEATDA